MALNENAAIVAAGGYMFFGDPGTPFPEEEWETADLNVTDPAPLTGLESVGFTSLDDLPEFGSDGGDSETLGSWERKVMRVQQTETSTDYLVFNAYQFDTNVLSMYWGLGEVSPGKFSVREVGARKVEKSFAMIITDGVTRVAFYAPRASFQREDSLSLATDAFAQWPIRATWLNYENAPLFDWYGEGITVPDDETMVAAGEMVTA